MKTSKLEYAWREMMKRGCKDMMVINKETVKNNNVSGKSVNYVLLDECFPSSN